MNPTQQTVVSPTEVVHILVVHAKRWLIPTVLLSALALGYALVRRNTWEASQALIVRNEAANNQMGPGKFVHTDEMKALQETILELVRSRGVLVAAQEKVGPPANYREDAAAWPAGDDIEDLRDTIELTPPKGAEFGTTEVFYLQVRDRDRQRAIALNGAICEQLLERFQQLRDAKAQSMIDELAKTVHLAKADLTEATGRLTELETGVGSDLAELRVLNEAGSGGESAIRRTITEIRNELRQIGVKHKAEGQLLILLDESQKDPGRLLAAPNQLLELQPGLGRLKDGLVDAQLATAGLKGNMSDSHPLVQSAKQSEEEIGRHLHNELAIAIRGLQADMRADAERQALLQTQLDEATERLSRLAELRATYSNLLAETANRAALVERAEQNLAEARASHASANAFSLISRIDDADTGVNPVGPSRSMIVLVGFAGGLLAGLGLLFLTVQPARPDAAETRPGNYLALPTPPVQFAFRPTQVAIQPGRSLSFNEALRKIDYASRV